MSKTRAEHLAADGDLDNAFVSMLSDLRKHSELADHIGLTLGALELAAGLLETRDAMRRWIEGFR